MCGAVSRSLDFIPYIKPPITAIVMIKAATPRVIPMIEIIDIKDKSLDFVENKYLSAIFR
jgi:hypothetical protein